MSKLLREELHRYRAKTLELISTMKNESYDKLEKLLLEREQIITAISNLQYSEEEFINNAEALDIVQHEVELAKLMDKKRGELLDKIDGLKESQQAARCYFNAAPGSSLYFNKKV